MYSPLPAPTIQPGQGKCESNATEFPCFSVSSDEILRGQKTVAINHNGLTYRLQATRLGKLILTK